MTHSEEILNEALIPLKENGFHISKMRNGDILTVWIELPPIHQEEEDRGTSFYMRWKEYEGEE